MQAAIPTLAGRTALVTGASRGIGRAVAQQLAERGARVAMVARDRARLEAGAAELRAAGHEALPVELDLADASQVSKLPERLGPFAQVDVLINCAAVMCDPSAKMTLRTPDAEWRRVMGTNFEAPLALCLAFVPGMVERRFGRVVNVSACLGRMSGPGTSGGLASYRISKAALNALTKNLAAELAGGRRGVNVDAVCPGHTRTDMGGPKAPRSIEQGADTIVWLAEREQSDPTGLLWEDREVIPW